MQAEAPGFVVVMPAHNAERYLARTLPALIEAASGAEVIVVDDASTDDSFRVAGEYGIRVVRLDRHGGASEARNRGVRESTADIVVFVDADVLVEPSSIARLVERLEATGADAVFGSYDDDPPAPGFFSQYANLRHHYYHQRGEREARTFWAGFGAVRRESIARSGGFDDASSGVEDIAMGYRLVAAGGRIVMEPGIQVTHLKSWTMVSLLRTDLFMRALPWSRLIVSGVGGAALNVNWQERLRAGLAALLALCAASWPLGVLGWQPVGVLAGLAIASNGRLGMFLFRRRGAWFACRALAWHQLYYLYGILVFVFAWFESIAARRRGRMADPADR